MNRDLELTMIALLLREASDEKLISLAVLIDHERASRRQASEDPVIREHRVKLEKQAKRRKICPSCQEKTKGSESKKTGTRYPYCSKCITRATPPTDSYATNARGTDPGPFEDIR
jgi:hypothetical protein